YTLATVGDPTAFDSVLHIRTTCLDPESELGCNDDEGGPQSGLLVGLEAQQTVLVFLDAATDDAGGPVGLTILAADASRAPVIESVRALRGLAGVHLFVDGGDVNGDAIDLTVAALADGDVLGAEERVELPPAFGQRHFRGTAVGLPLAPEADAVRVRARDRAGNMSNFMDVAIADPPRPAEGEPCDLAGVEDRCADGTVCLAADAGATCSGSSPPSLLGGHVWRHGADLTAAVDGEDATLDARDLRGQFLGAGGPIAGAEVVARPLDDPQGSERFTLLVRAPGVVPPAATGIRLWIRDARDLESEPRDFVFEALPARAQGEACDPRHVRDACAAPGSCLAGDAPVCVPPQAPVLQRAEFFVSARRDLLGVRVVGTDPDEDVTGMAVRILDFAGRDIINGPNEPAAIPFDRLAQADGAFDGAVLGELQPGFPQFDRIELAAVDAQGLRSAFVVAVPGEPVPRAADERCDYSGLMDFCPRRRPASTGPLTGTSRAPRPRRRSWWKPTPGTTPATKRSRCGSLAPTSTTTSRCSRCCSSTPRTSRSTSGGPTPSRRSASASSSWSARTAPSSAPARAARPRAWATWSGPASGWSTGPSCAPTPSRCCSRPPPRSGSASPAIPRPP
ncbi:MAG: hypothetical protein R3F60_27835, partial [bacterium]